MTGDWGDFSSGSWELHPVLDVPDRFPPAVMFSIRDSNPQPEYESSLRELLGKQRDRRMDPASSVAPEMMRQGMLHVAWDSVFREVPGDRVGLLFRNEGRQAGEEEGEEVATYTVVIKSNEPAGKKWFVTRASRFEGRIVCWCLPIEVHKGTRTAIALTPQNMLTLTMVTEDPRSGT
jgi:hypothetical protein